MWEGLDTGIVVCQSLVILATVIGISGTYWNRRQQPLKARLPNLLVLAGILLALGQVLDLVATALQWSSAGCIFGIASDWILRVPLQLTLAARAFSLWFRLRLTMKRVEAMEEYRTRVKTRKNSILLMNVARSSSTTPAAGLPKKGRLTSATILSSISSTKIMESIKKVSWFEKNKHMMTQRYLYYCISIASGVLLFWLAAVIVVGEDCSAYRSVPHLVTIIIPSVINVFWLVKVGWTIRNSPDAFGIRQDNAFIVFGVGVLSLLILPLRLASESIGLELAAISQFVFVVYLTIAIIYQPFIHTLSFVAVDAQPTTTVASLATLDQVLDYPKGREYFRKFLEGEMSLENLLFYEAAFEYRESAIQDYVAAKDSQEVDIEVLESCQDIINTYIGKDASIPINVSFAITAKILKQFKELVESLGNPKLQSEEAKLLISKPSGHSNDDLNKIVVDEEGKKPEELKKIEDGIVSSRRSSAKPEDKLEAGASGGLSVPVDASGAEKRKGPSGGKHKRGKSGNVSWGDFVGDLKALSDVKSLGEMLPSEVVSAPGISSATETKPASSDDVKIDIKGEEEKKVPDPTVVSKPSAVIGALFRSGSDVKKDKDLIAASTVTEEKKPEEKKHRRARSQGSLSEKKVHHVKTKSSGMGTDEAALRLVILKEKPLVTLFDEALKEVFRLMATDTFVRFRRSDMFKELQNMVQTDRDTAKVLKELKLL